MKKILIVVWLALLIVSCNDRGVDERKPAEPIDKPTWDTLKIDTLKVVDTVK